MNCQILDNNKAKEAIQKCIDESCGTFREKFQKFLDKDLIVPVHCKDVGNKRTFGFFNGQYVSVNVPVMETGFWFFKSADCNKLCQVLEHEFIHAVCYWKPIIVYSKLSFVLETFYRTLWSHFVKEEFVFDVAKANYNIAILTDRSVGQYNVRLDSYNQNLLKTFYNFLVDNSDIFIDKETFIAVIKTVYDLFTNNTYHLRPVIENAFQDAYHSIYNTPSYLNILFGQEFVFASEVLSIAANVNTPEARKVVTQILNLI